jgi:hypothetical protein
MNDEVRTGSGPPAAGAGATEEKLALARAAMDGATDAEALKALDRAFKESKERGRADSLREVAALAETLHARSSGTVAKEAAHLAYAASQNVRLFERRAVMAAGTVPIPAAVGDHQPPAKSGAAKPTRIDWLIGIGWIGLCIAAGIVAGDAYGKAIDVEWSTRDFVLGFVLIPLAIGTVAGFLIRPKAPFAQSLPVASAGAVVLGFTMATQLDLSPGSEACPSGCENDIGYAGVAFIIITFLPLASGMLVGRLARRRVGSNSPPIT